MTDETTTTTNEALEQFKSVFASASTKLRCLSSPKEELETIAQVISEAAATNRMETDPEFATFINDEVAIGIMQKMAKTLSYDNSVSHPCLRAHAYPDG